MSTKETLDEAAAVLDSIEEKLDVLEAPIAEVIEIKRNYGKIGGLILLGVVIGSGVTYVVAKKKFEKGLEARIDKEVQDSLQFLVKQMGLDKLIVTNEDPDEIPGVEGEGEFDQELDAAMDPYKPTPEIEVEIVTAEAPVIVDEPLEPVDGERVFGTQEGKPSLEDLAKRNQTVNYATPVPSSLEEDTVDEIVPEEEPYEDPDISVISRDIFYANGTEWPQETLTYFSDGGVLDVAGDFVTDPNLSIGERKPPFGQMSEDANVVYLRNEKLKKEFEVIFDAGNASAFANSPEGEDTELHHSIQSLAEQYRPEHLRR